jgi:hypothetical protein
LIFLTDPLGGAVGGGTRLKSELRPIDLIIQDELHLISGPLGTIAGLYESAFDLLAAPNINGEWRRPKIIASTATVRRAETQIRNLFGRERTAIFPPPGIGRDDSFFAKIDTETPSRLYLGVASPGRGPKLVFLRALQTVLSGAAALSSGGSNDPGDPYLTALCYFNALRELGGARRIVDDEVRAHLTSGCAVAAATRRQIEFGLLGLASPANVRRGTPRLQCARRRRAPVSILVSGRRSAGCQLGRRFRGPAPADEKRRRMVEFAELDVKSNGKLSGMYCASLLVPALVALRPAALNFSVSRF